MTTSPLDTRHDMVSISDIVIDDRSREDLGDIDALAESIQRFGLIHPIVIDEDNTLIAGRRRLAAAVHLGWEYIPTTRYGSLTARERLDLELEENERRQELSVYERAKAIARLAAIAREVAIEEVDQDPGCAESAHPPPSHRRPGSFRDLEARLNVRESTIRAAEQHVRAVEFYPELAPLPQYQVFEIANRLDRLPPEEREPYRQRLAENPEGVYKIAWDLKRHKQNKAAARKQARHDAATSVDPVTAAIGPGAAAIIHAGGMPTLADILRSDASVLPPLTPEEEAERSQQEMRRVFAQARDPFWEVLRIRPRALRKALEPADMQEVREFIAKLRVWVDQWEEVL